MRHTGTVKWFDPDKGYGFIAHEDGRDVFVHHRTIQVSGMFDGLEEGQLVGYELNITDRGPTATNLTRPGELPEIDGSGLDPLSKLAELGRAAHLAGGAAALTTLVKLASVYVDSLPGSPRHEAEPTP